MAHKLTIPTFEGSICSFWKVKMRGYLISPSYKTWKAVETKYVQLTNGPTTLDEVEAYEENERERYDIFSVVSKIESKKVVDLDTAYEVWERLKSIYEGNERVKLSKMQTTKGRYENLKMEEGGGVERYFQKVGNVVNAIKDLGSILDEKDVIQKIMSTLPKCYSDKISAIKETYDPSKFTRK